MIRTGPAAASVRTVTDGTTARGPGGPGPAPHGRPRHPPAAEPRRGRRFARRTAACVGLLGWISAPALLPAGAPAAGPVAHEELLVFAAASTGAALTDLARAYAAAGGGRVRVSLAATSALARQIESGAPADLFIAANPMWMDHIEEAGLLAPSTRALVFRNRLVLVASADTDPGPVEITPSLNLAALLDGGRLAIAEPHSVPAGIYARQALESLGVWAGLRGRLAPAGDVRHAARLVGSGEAALGIIYWTDARATPGIRILGILAPDLHDPVTYWAARLAAAPAPAAAAAFLAFLQSDTARAIVSRHGFTLPADAHAR